MNTATTTTTAANTSTPAKLEGPPATDKARLIELIDGAMADFDRGAAINRDAAKQLGEHLIEMKKTHIPHTPKFNVWFVGRYKRTPQSAMKWMRLAREWGKCETAWKADTNPDKTAWERLSVDDTLDLISKPHAAPKSPTPKPSEKIAELEKQLAETKEALKTMVAEKQVFDADTPFDEAITIYPELERLCAAILSKQPDTVYRMKSIKIGGKAIPVDHPILLLPESIDTPTTTEG